MPDSGNQIAKHAMLIVMKSPTCDQLFERILYVVQSEDYCSIGGGLDVLNAEYRKDIVTEAYASFGIAR
jgi:hypothetical protein